MRTLFISLLTVALGIAAHATVVDNIAGYLETQATDHSITTLTVTGTIDARDFKFIADSLVDLNTLDLSQAQIVGYSSSNKPLVGTFFTFPADELPATVLMGSEISSIVLPQGLKSLGHASLAGCTNLAQIELPESLTTIGSYALSGSGITAVTLPQSITSIGEGAFARCDSLLSVSISVKEIPAYAFFGTASLSQLTLSNSVTTIGRGAFNGCTALNDITIAEDNNIKVIDAEAFIGASAQGFDLSQLASLEAIGDWAFAGSALQHAHLPLTVGSMGQGAFYYASALTAATLPQGLTVVPDYAFAGTALTGTFELSEDIESLGGYAFYNDSTISVFTIPATVSYLGSWAMAGMTGLDTINAVPTTVPELGDSVWAGVVQSAVMLNTADNDIADLYADADQWKEFHILRNYLVGDVNMDGNVDVIDVNATVAHILGQEVDPFDREAADLNHDGTIDVIDVNALVALILEGRHEYIRKIKGRKAAQDNITTDCVTIEDFAIANGETRDIEFMLNNARSYSAMQFDIDLPQGLEIVPASIACTSRGNNCSVLLSSKQDRIMLYSASVDPFNGNDGAIIKAKVKASSDVQGSISISNIIFSTPLNQRFVGTDSYAMVSAATGINDANFNNDKVYAQSGHIVIETDSDASAQIVAMNGMAHDLTAASGRTQVAVDAGIYVVVLNGKTYKVAVK